MMLIRTRVAPSPIHGMGLFTVAPVAQGTPIWCFEPGFDRAFTPEQFNALPARARDHIRWFSYVNEADGNRILSGDHACFINHSTEPNTGTLPDAPAPVTTVALRDLAADEEITCNYFAFDAEAVQKLGLELAKA